MDDGTIIDGLAPLLLPILVAALVAMGSPGPATIAIARESMAHGRGAGVALSLGVTTGSWIWSGLAAGGMGAVLLAHGWVIDHLRIAAALYLGWLAWKSARSALRPRAEGAAPPRVPASRSYLRGLMIHLTNPKPILFFGALFSVGLPQGSSPEALFLVAAVVGVQSLLVFAALALAFSSTRVAAGYVRLRRLFEAAFALVFGTAAAGFLLSAFLPFWASVRRAPS